MSRPASATDLTAELRNLRLPRALTLLGLVAQTGAPYYTDDYQNGLVRDAHLEADPHGPRSCLRGPAW
jgi:hypothetical protein